MLLALSAACQPSQQSLLRIDVYYEEAWWYSLNLTRGVFPSDGKKYPGDIFWQSDQQLPVYGRCKSRYSLPLSI